MSEKIIKIRKTTQKQVITAIKSGDFSVVGTTLPAIQAGNRFTTCGAVFFNRLNFTDGFCTLTAKII